ncbi:peptide chain release factor N(5)-glutamine methyltransferase [Halomonas sp. ML-15]|uniref:peptide chain release factor N(5)-glutamine methyltransferase n=1 Tax=Halomonas sp. ML-15 TaxID=2773305 RepID=UPI0017468E8A|nr:peptide chain release factor N(5)-glutamine methyltransferase [Halomonas sp. ML-15]MBD3897329.1 peptide chain release factor N(5)-glutamine methyltransferase [Halomonas sp. ML-15]
MRLDQLVVRATRRLASGGSPSPRLDAEVLLCHVLERDRTWLYTWGDRTIEAWPRARFEALLALRASGWPVAYLTGEREFWGLMLATSPATLIPRPDTERLVEAALGKATAPAGELLDLGTGTGAIALAFACECPGWRVLGVDREPGAVALARANAERLAITNARFCESDWFTALAGQRFALIVTNPPYLAADDPHLEQGDVRFEPHSALVAEGDGMVDLRGLIVQAREHLLPGGWLLLEHGMAQGQAVRAALGEAGYRRVATLEDLGGRERVSLGCVEG